MKLLPQYEGLTIEQATIKRGLNTEHRYRVSIGDKAVRCGCCRSCKSKKKANICDGMPSVTSFSGQYGGGGLYPGGYKAALDAVFGTYTDKTKTALTDTGWMRDLTHDARFGKNPLKDDDFLIYRQEVEEIPTPGAIARDFGTGVHQAIDKLLSAHKADCDCDQTQFHDPEIPAQYAPAVDAVVDWLKRGGADGPYVVEDTEVDVYHPDLLYGGQIDCVARCSNSVIVIDWKSGREIYPNHAMQVAAYAFAYEALTGEKVAEGWIVKTGRHGFEAKQIENLEIATNAFIAMQETKRNVDQIKWSKEIK